MLFAGWEVYIVKNCDRGRPRSQFFTIQTELKLVNNLFILSKLSNEKKKSRKKTHASVTVTVVRHSKIRTGLRANQIVGFVTMPAWKKIMQDIFPDSILRAQVTDMTTIPGLWSRSQWHDMAIKYNDFIHDISSFHCRIASLIWKRF